MPARGRSCAAAPPPSTCSPLPGLSPRRRAGYLRARAAGMSTGAAATFTVGLVQMRSGVSPAANLDAAVRLIDDAKRAGADYVQTPEMSNIMEVKRERLFAALAPEES